MFHKVYWGDIDTNLIQQDPYNPDWVLFAVWENKRENTSAMYFVTDPILVFDLAYKNKETVMAQSGQGDPYTGQQILNMIKHYVPANRHYAIGKRLS
tara:strand:- start:42 stop:332 length:291 start_codon:yes stop_codon:yes gene_type:complete